jgi:ferredoxin-thioredoxin reductase catalytic subunit
MEISQDQIEKRIKEYEEHARLKGFQLNPNKKIVENIVRAILKKEAICGSGYCPCRRTTGDKQEDKKIICPCIYHLQELEDQGYCHCRLFVK